MGGEGVGGGGEPGCDKGGDFPEDYRGVSWVMWRENKAGRRVGGNVPAPVVPPPRVEERMVGDW